jgi:hypothetical protein
MVHFNSSFLTAALSVLNSILNPAISVRTLRDFGPHFPEIGLCRKIALACLAEGLRQCSRLLGRKMPFVPEREGEAKRIEQRGGRVIKVQRGRRLPLYASISRPCAGAQQRARNPGSP